MFGFVLFSQTHTKLEEAIGDLQTNQLARKFPSKESAGVKVKDLLLQSLSSEEQRRGFKGTAFLKEKQLFKMVVDSKLHSLGVSLGIMLIKVNVFIKVDNIASKAQ